MTKVSVDIEELITFNDDSAEVAAHASAVKAIAGEELGLAFLKEYFRRQDAGVEILPERCTSGERKGVRLDAWLKLTVGLATKLYQVEVKSWSYHSLGGRRLAHSASASNLKDFKIERWKRYWDGTAFKDKELNKVLTPMRSPLHGVPVEPLACLWDAVHPSGADDPFFTVALPSGPFSQVSVFSVSGFLRGLRLRRIELDLPGIHARLGWLAKIFPS